MPEDFGSLLNSIARVFPASHFEPVVDAELAILHRRFPGVPEHYLEFLQHVGWGSLGDGHFMIYNCPCEPDEFFDTETTQQLNGIVFIGDNFSGWMLGFDTRDGWRMVGVESASLQSCPEDVRTIAEFIAQRITDRESARRGSL